MSKGPHVRPGVTHSTPDVTMIPDGELRDADGLLIDEYVEEPIKEPETDAVRRDDIDPDPDEETAR